MIFFGILRIKLNFSFPLSHFPVHLYEKKLVISPAAKPEVEENIAVSVSVFYGFSLVKNLRDANKLSIYRSSCLLFAALSALTP